MKLFTSPLPIYGCIALLIVCFSSVGFADSIADDKRPEEFVSFSTTVDGETQPVVVYVPKNYDAGKKWPLVVFLHGMGERGADGWVQTEVGIGKAILENPDRFPCLVVMPQCSDKTVWSASSNTKGPLATRHIDASIEHVLNEYTIDEDRVSLTGLSMGGFGTFAYGAANAERFSAFMPVCGGGNPEDAAGLAKRPVWVFHGGADPVVAPDRSKTMVEAIREAGGDVKYTEYEGVGHNSWDRAYGHEEAIDWLLAQNR